VSVAYLFCRLSTFIHSHPFSHRLEVLRPRWVVDNPGLPNIPLPAEDSYLFVTCRLCTFLSLPFLEAVVDRLGMPLKLLCESRFVPEFSYLLPICMVET